MVFLLYFLFIFLKVIILLGFYLLHIIKKRNNMNILANIKLSQIANIWQAMGMLNHLTWFSFLLGRNSLWASVLFVFFSLSPYLFFGLSEFYTFKFLPDSFFDVTTVYWLLTLGTHGTRGNWCVEMMIGILI